LAAVQRVYLETSFFRYLSDPPSSDPVKLDRQRRTRSWWKVGRQSFRLFVSPLVVDEYCDVGVLTAEEKAKRISLVQSAEFLALTSEVRELARALVAPRGPLPVNATADAVHWAVASIHSCDYLLTWNYRHLNNAAIKRRAEEAIRKHGATSPTVCSPEQLV